VDRLIRGSRFLPINELELAREAEWIEEIERRAREIDEGLVETIPGDQVIREALDRLK